MNRKHRSARNNTKLATTAIIWGFATAMMAICIPMIVMTIEMTRVATIIPLAVVLGASGSTVAVWRSGGQQVGEIDELTDKFRVIQERVTDLETICSAQELEFGKKFEQLEPKDRHRS